MQKLTFAPRLAEPAFIRKYRVYAKHSHTSQTTPDTPIGVCRVVSPNVNAGI